MKARNIRLTAFGVACAFILVAIPLSTAAVARTNQSGCVKIGGVESSGARNWLDPATVPSTQTSMYLNAAYNRLLDADDNFKLRPELATSWSSNSKATTWTFRLRRGVKFHDGHELTSADVVYTYKRLIDPKVGSEAAGTLSVLRPSGIIAADKYTVVFKTANPVAELPLLITTKNTYIVANGATTQSLKSRAAGTGPFIPTNFRPGQQSYTFQKNPNYWQKGFPKTNCLQFFVIQDAAARTAALRTGQIDLAERVDYSEVPTLKQDRNLKLLVTPAATSMSFVMWVDTAPFNDNRVRTALKKVVDRQRMVDTVLLGYGVVGDDNPIPPTSPFAWRSSVPKQDIPGAKQLLSTAGYGPSNPLKVTLYTSEFIPGAVQLAQLYKQMAAEADVEVNVIVGPASEHWDTAWLKQPFVGSGWNMRPPGEGIAIAHRSNAKENETHWKVKSFDALLAKAYNTLDAEDRTNVYKQLGRILSTQGGDILPAFQRFVAVIRTDCSGYTPRANGTRTIFTNISCR